MKKIIVLLSVIFIALAGVYFILRAPEKAEEVIPEVAEPADYIDLEPAEENFVFMKGGEFRPGTLSISAGEAVTWFNHNTMEHTVTSIDSGVLDSGFLESGESYTHVFGEPGEFDYYSRPDPSITGKIIVE